MTIKTSGTLSIYDIYTEMGGSPPHSMSEYYNADDKVPASGTISVSDFYGRSRPLAANYTVISSYAIPATAGGVGEGFWRTCASWTNNTDRRGTIRCWGNVRGGSQGRGGYSSFSKQSGVAVYVDGVALYNSGVRFGEPVNNYHAWDSAVTIKRGSYIYVSAMMWGSFGRDCVIGGALNIGGS
jgi:hypothetical protein